MHKTKDNWFMGAPIVRCVWNGCLPVKEYLARWSSITTKYRVTEIESELRILTAEFDKPTLCKWFAVFGYRH
jgi:hypothetical protein